MRAPALMVPRRPGGTVRGASHGARGETRRNVFGPNAAAGALRFVSFLHSFVCFWAMGLACRSCIFFLNIFAPVLFSSLWRSCRVTPSSFSPHLLFLCPLSLPPQSSVSLHHLLFTPSASIFHFPSLLHVPFLPPLLGDDALALSRLLPSPPFGLSLPPFKPWFKPSRFQPRLKVPTRFKPLMVLTV
ncbi:hypothetical protein B0H13DRAFT_313609 [Mycena leptocephala]|nr:hypothetical protein B0H13DRAFT_313609 [Mycena leptocephala]